MLFDHDMVAWLGETLAYLNSLLVFMMVIFFYHKSEAKQEKERVSALLVATLGLVAFASVFQLANTLFTTFTKKYVDHNLFGIVTPTTEQFEAFNPLFVILFGIPGVSIQTLPSSLKLVSGF